MENKPEHTESKRYHLYYSEKDRNYIITENPLDAFDHSRWIHLEDMCALDLVELLKKHEKPVGNNKTNLCAKVPEQIIVDKSNAAKSYPIRETQFTQNSRLNNELNLSERGAKIIQFKSKEMREAEERFYHLADHLLPEKTKEDPENSA